MLCRLFVSGGRGGHITEEATNAESHLWSTPQTSDISINPEGQGPCPPTPVLAAARPLAPGGG